MFNLSVVGVGYTGYRNASVLDLVVEFKKIIEPQHVGVAAVGYTA